MIGEIEQLSLRLIGIGLLSHEMLYLSTRGHIYWTDTSFPVLGLKTSHNIKVLVHIMVLITGISLIVLPSSEFVQVVTLIVLLIFIASFPKRLSNHLPLALALLCAHIFLDNSTSTIQIVIVLLYFFGALHKLNRDYFDKNQSCGYGLAITYLLHKNWYRPLTASLAALIGIYVVVMGEFLLAVSLLLIPYLLVPSIVFAILLHTQFGFMAHVPFSILSFSGLVCFFDSLPIFGTWHIALIFTVGPILGVFLGDYRNYRLAFIGALNHVLLGILCVSGIVALFLSPELVKRENIIEFEIGSLLLLAIWILNGSSPYLGIKFDFSMAMFSNLRPDIRSHYFLPNNTNIITPRYCQVYEVHQCDQRSSDQAKAIAEIDYRNTWYAIGFIASIAKQLELNFLVSIREADGLNTEISVDEQTWDQLPRSEKISVYPVSLPPHGQPLCA